MAKADKRESELGDRVEFKKHTSSKRLLLLPFLACSPLALLLLKGAPLEWSVFFGRLHLAMLHLPIGILLLVALMELVTLLSRGRLSYRTDLPVFVAAFTTVASTVCGILLADSEASTGPLITSHLRWGIATAVFTVLALAFRCAPNYQLGKLWPWAYQTALLVACGMLIWTGHQGGSITHGEQFLTERIPWRSTPLAKGAVEIPPPGAPVYYEPTMAALFAAKCNSCHKQAYFKGGLIMDSYEALLRGGDSGACVLPGQSASSTIITSILLPISDDDHMPPKDKSQLTAQEVEAIERWVQGGALRSMLDNASR
ncbi:c-type cytochrome domain-containing protein [Cerasicoccus maritimus]|uniref:c-type cytochrome domain-containing protein n=1 Tax=Cerasicoccus maritimus TaxID=490089 RepID=UPI002852C9EB|nr:c-type cytochrome domain-containing protein [Cerasicoccus maritimus]